MKKIITLFVLICLFCLNGVLAQQINESEETVFSNEIHSGAFQIFIGEFYLHYEKQINYNAFLVYGSITDSHTSSADNTGWFAGAQYRRYLKLAMDATSYNAYVGGLAGYGFKEKKDYSGSSSVYYFRTGIMLGVKVFLYDYISLDFNWANIYQNPSVENTSGDSNFNSEMVGLAYRGFRPQVNCTVGIRF